jgi:hypothetical protein
MNDDSATIVNISYDSNQHKTLPLTYEENSEILMLTMKYIGDFNRFL